MFCCLLFACLLFACLLSACLLFACLLLLCLLLSACLLFCFCFAAAAAAALCCCCYCYRLIVLGTARVLLFFCRLGRASFIPFTSSFLSNFVCLSLRFVLCVCGMPTLFSLNTYILCTLFPHRYCINFTFVTTGYIVAKKSQQCELSTTTEQARIRQMLRLFAVDFAVDFFSYDTLASLHDIVCFSPRNYSPRKSDAGSVSTVENFSKIIRCPCGPNRCVKPSEAKERCTTGFGGRY